MNIGEKTVTKERTCIHVMIDYNKTTVCSMYTCTCTYGCLYNNNFACTCTCTCIYRVFEIESKLSKSCTCTCNT